MTARRQARGRSPLLEPATPGAVPAAFLVGRCIEVWAAPGSPMPTSSATRRFDRARDHWTREQRANPAEARALIPTGAPWSVKHLSYIGQAERIGRPLGQIVLERLRAAGCTPTDLPALAEQADNLYEASRMENL